MAIITAAYYSIRNLGSVVGASVVSAVIQQALHTFLTAELQRFDVDVEAIIEQATTNLNSIATLDPEVASVVRACYGAAISRSLLVIFSAALCALVPASLIRGGRRSESGWKQLERA